MDTSTDGSLWPTSSADYILKNVIGSGAFATVYRADCPAMEKQVAIKVIDLETGGKRIINMDVYLHNAWYNCGRYTTILIS